MSLFLVLSGGFFVPLETIPTYLRWMKHIGYFTYGFQLYSVNEFSNRQFSCNNLPSNISSVLCNGDSIVQNLGFTPSDYQTPIMALCIIFTSFVVLSWMIFSWFPQNPLSMAPTIANSMTATSKSTEDELNSCALLDSSSKGVTVELIDYTLEFPGRRNEKSRVILDSINGKFLKGKLTGILGTSGAGKSTLLTMIHGSSTGYPKYVTKGKITFGGEKKGLEDVFKLTSFVRQDDGHLLPGLTCR